jgi:hypothetical protein
LASYIYIVGAFQGWNAASPDSLVSATSNGVYTGTFAFPAGPDNNQFLILPVKNSYDVKYAAANSNGPSSALAIGANNNISSPAAAGTYAVRFDINALTISFTAK